MTASNTEPKEYRICRRCVMDTSDPEIRFNEQGVCNHCLESDAQLAAARDGGGGRERASARLVDRVRSAGRGRKYDVVIGLSGGVDSTYLAYLTVKQFGLRPLAVHFDNGWNSELAVHNIQQTVQKLGIDLYTYIVDWAEFRDLQLAFFKSHTSGLEIPTDHAIPATIYRAAAKHGVHHIFSGGNLATESILPKAWQHAAIDLTFLRSIHRRHGTQPLRSFPVLGLTHLAYFTFVRNIAVHRPLNLVEYDKAKAIETVVRELNWRPYGVKHGESTFTRFFQCYILPRKFGIDKRRAHLSSLIASHQMDRAAALAELQRNEYEGGDNLEADIRYITKKLGMTRAEFDEYMAAPPVAASAYPNRAELMARLLPIWRRLRDR